MNGGAVVRPVAIGDIDVDSGLAALVDGRYRRDRSGVERSPAQPVRHDVVARDGRHVLNLEAGPPQGAVIRGEGVVAEEAGRRKRTGDARVTDDGGTEDAARHEVALSVQQDSGAHVVSAVGTKGVGDGRIHSPPNRHLVQGLGRARRRIGGSRRGIIADQGGQDPGGFPGGTQGADARIDGRTRKGLDRRGHLDLEGDRGPSRRGNRGARGRVEAVDVLHLDTHAIRTRGVSQVRAFGPSGGRIGDGIVIVDHKMHRAISGA